MVEWSYGYTMIYIQKLELLEQIGPFPNGNYMHYGGYDLGDLL